jgi:hypothetical protein
MSAKTITPLRQRMIEDMNARKLGVHTLGGHIYSCKRFAAFLKRSQTLRQPRTFASSSCTFRRPV